MFLFESNTNARDCVAVPGFILFKYTFDWLLVILFNDVPLIIISWQLNELILEIFLLEFTTNTLLELAVPGVTIVLFNSVDVEFTCWLLRVNVFTLVVKVL